MQTTRTGAQSIYPAVRYSDAPAAIEWLKAAIGFTEHDVYAGENGSIAHAQLALNGNLIMMGSTKDDSFGKSPKTLGGTTGSIYIALATAADVDALYIRAKTHGATIVREIEDTDYGSHDFSLRDPEGHMWSFGTYAPQAG